MRSLSILAIACVLAACSSQEPAVEQRRGSAAEGSRGRGGAEAVPVETVLVVRGPISASLAFNSTLETESIVDIFPQIGGQVEALYVEEGDRVVSGQPLLQIDDRELLIELDESEANLRHLEATFSRFEEMYQRELLNRQEYDNQKFQMDQARLRFERAKIRLDHATVRAPFDGVISARDVQVGARVTTGARLFSLVALDEMVARVFVPGRHLPVVAEGQPAIISSDFLPGRSYEGWVKRISPVVDPRSGTFRVTVGVTGEPDALRPGLFVNVRIVTETRDNALLVPKQALVYEAGDQYVFKVVDGRARRLRLDAGFENPSVIEVRTGLDAGDEVIVLGQSGLRDGASVRVVNTHSGGGAAASISQEPAGEQG